MDTQVASALWLGLVYIHSRDFWGTALSLFSCFVPELRRADVEMDHREVVVQSSMAMLRACVDLDKTYMDGGGELQMMAQVLTPASLWVHLCSLMFLT